MTQKENGRMSCQIHGAYKPEKVSLNRLMENEEPQILLLPVEQAAKQSGTHTSHGHKTHIDFPPAEKLNYPEI